MRVATSSRVISYTRVSTADQAASGLGLEAQAHAVEAYAARWGLPVAGRFSDEGVSGAAPLNERRGLLGAIGALQPGDVLVVAKLDRLSRGDLLEAMLVEELIGRRRARVVSAAGEGTDRDDDPTALLTKRLLQLVASYEKGLIGARTRAALAAKKARGERVGALPYGQTAEECAVLEIITASREAGASLQATAEALNLRGLSTRKGTAWKAQYVHSLLRTRTGTTRPASPRRPRHRATLAALEAMTHSA